MEVDVQVDWVSAILDPGPLWPAGMRLYNTGELLAVSPDGEIVMRRSGRVVHEGSYDNKLIIASHDGAQLYLSGNPVKFFQGHNLFGSTDHWGLWLAAGVDVRQRLGLFPGPQTAESLFSPPRLTRVDLTRTYAFANDGEAREWLRDVAGSARSRHRGDHIPSGGTVYFGKHSTRWSLKAYLKSDELRSKETGHALPATLPQFVRRELMDWSEGKVRFEVTLRTPELVKLGKDWDAMAVWSEYYGRITWNRNADLVEGLDMVDEAQLTPTQAGYLARWRLGEDLRRKMSKAAFYKQRAAILAAIRVDIANTPPPREKPAPEPSQRVSAVLDPAGWDPEPIQAHVYEPDPEGELKRSYRLL